MVSWRFQLFMGSVLLVMMASGCKSSKQSPGKWQSYQEIQDRQEQQLRKELKVASREMYAPNEADSLGAAYLTGKVFYDELGQDTLELNFLPNGSISKETRKVFRDSLLLSVETKESNGYSSKSEMRYNESGFRIQELMFKRGDTLLRRDYQFDEAGNEVHVDLYTYRDKGRLVLDTQRDAQGRPVLVKEANLEGKANWTENYQMSDTLWQIIRKDKEGKVTSDFELKFGPDGKLKSMKNMDENGRVRMHATYQHDEKGQMIREEFWSPQGISTQYTLFSYDERGLLKERRYHSPQLAKPIISQYKYNFR